MLDLFTRLYDVTPFERRKDMRSRNCAAELKNSSTRTLFLVDEDEDEVPIERDCAVFIVWARSTMQMKMAYCVCGRIYIAVGKIWTSHELQCHNKLRPRTGGMVW